MRIAKAAAAGLDVARLSMSSKQPMISSATSTKRSAPAEKGATKMMLRYPEIRADDARVLAFASLIRAEQHQEAVQGFPTLRQIPSTGIIKLLDYFNTLSDDERAAQIEFQARLAALMFFPAPLIGTAHEQLRTMEPAALRRAEAMSAPGFAYGLRYEGLRMHRAMINDPESIRQLARTRATLDFTPRDDLPAELVGSTPIRDIVTARAP